MHFYFILIFASWLRGFPASMPFFVSGLRGFLPSQLLGVLASRILAGVSHQNLLPVYKDSKRVLLVPTFF